MTNLTNLTSLTHQGASAGLGSVSYDWYGITLRLTLALVAGGAIGWNRQLHRKAAGLRTHMLVSLGAALFVLVALGSNPPASSDTSRVIQGVSTGVGFLGAGEILQASRPGRAHQKITGLTSAAAIWVTAALGVAAACGLWQLVTIAVSLALLVLGGAKWLEQAAPPPDPLPTVPPAPPSSTSRLTDDSDP